MASFFGMKRLSRPEDWKPIVGKKNWVEGCSAFELAYKWQCVRNFPENVWKLMKNGPDPLLLGLQAEQWIVEKPVYLGNL